MKGLFFLGVVTAGIFAFLFSLVRKEIKDTRSMRFSDRAAGSVGLVLAVGGSLATMTIIAAIKIGAVAL